MLLQRSVLRPFRQILRAAPSTWAKTIFNILGASWDVLSFLASFQAAPIPFDRDCVHYPWDIH